MNHTLGHRDSTDGGSAWPTHTRTDWKAAAWAGVIAGLVFVMVEILLVWMVQGMSPWAPSGTELRMRVPWSLSGRLSIRRT
jgi:hypothetical protein